MSQSAGHASSRRDFLKTSGKIVAGSALAGVAIPRVHAADSQTINLALVGCGGRGTGAVGNALGTKGGPVKLVAMADVFENKLKNSFTTLKRAYAGKVDIPDDRKFLGFDAYKHAIDCLQPGDVAIFATPPAFRWVHFTYAVQKGVNVFMEKPVTVDGPTSRRMFKLAEEADKKRMKVGVGLMVRHCRARRELFDRIQNGAIGDILLMRAYRMHGTAGSAFSKPRPRDITDLMFQVRRFHSFIWASGGLFSDFYIHQIDECCWMKNAWPIQAHGLGGRHFRGENIDQNFDTYSVEYTFPDNTKFFMNGRSISGCHDEFSSTAHGTKGVAIISKSGHTPGHCAIFRGTEMNSENMEWRARQPEANPYSLEWEDLLDAIRNDQPYNEVRRGVTASLVTSMGRMAAHTGQIVTYEDILDSDHELAPNIDRLTYKSDAPIKPDAHGKYPIPQPGVNTKTEY